MNTQTYTVNIRTGVVNITRVDVSQGDTGRTLAFKLYDGLIPFTPPNGSTVTIVGRKPSGLGFSETCTVSGNTAAVNTTLAMTQESGKIPVELRIESDTRSIGTANFVMHVEPSPHPAGTTDGTTEEARTVLAQCEAYAQEAQEAAEAASGDYTEIRSDVDDLTDRVDALESGGGGSGLTDDVKTALMNLVNHLAWDEDDPTGQTYITALYDALYPPADLVSISAVYTQSGTVYDTDSLNDLKSDLVVTAHYSDSTTGIVTGYTLSGTLAAGTSTITVAYSGKTTTFNVTVTEYSDVPSEYTWLYQSSSGTVLSADTTNIYNVLSQGTITEEISNGFLHVNLGSASNNYYQYELLPRIATNAVLTVKAKCNALANFSNNLTGMRLLLSNGTSGANLAIDRQKIRYGEGSTVMAVDYPTGFDYTDWHIYKLELTSNGHQIGYIDGVQIFDSATLSTSYSVENRLAFIQSISTYPTDVDVEWVAYLDRSAA